MFFERRQTPAALIQSRKPQKRCIEGPAPLVLRRSSRQPYPLDTDIDIDIDRDIDIVNDDLLDENSRGTRRVPIVVLLAPVYGPQ
mmetsp:Transcript_41116/g.86018  ORF Transcript_41116/g.86018 Transcript_41116/m.86018 type:complete len:85 (+) Transcript_41116:410-664(+)